MDVIVLFGQRKERYPGEYAPEALAVIDEVGNEDNPDYLNDEEAGARGTGEFESVVRLTLRFDGDKLMRLLRPQATVQASVVAS